MFNRVSNLLQLVWFCVVAMIAADCNYCSLWVVEHIVASFRAAWDKSRLS